MEESVLGRGDSHNKGAEAGEARKGRPTELESKNMGTDHTATWGPHYRFPPLSFF